MKNLAKSHGKICDKVQNGQNSPPQIWVPQEWKIKKITATQIFFPSNQSIVKLFIHLRNFTATVFSQKFRQISFLATSLVELLI